MKKVGIVIVNYNGDQYQNDCIESIYEMKYQNFEIIVVDSNSTDESIVHLRDRFPKIHIIEISENVGVARGNNIGISYGIGIGCEYTLLLNNDVIVEKELLTTLINKASEKVITVPKIYYYEPKQLIWFGGGYMDWKMATGKHEGMGSIDKELFNREKYITYAPTCCMLIHNSCFTTVGFIDEKVFMYFDDTDLCVRLLDAGKKILYVPTAYMWHKVSSSTGGEKSKYQVYYMTRNHFYFMDKYKERIDRWSRYRVSIKNIVKYILAPIRCKNDSYIRMAYYDYKRMKLGRNDTL